MVELVSLFPLCKNDFSKRSIMPCRRVLAAQSHPRSETGAIEEIFQCHEPFTKSKPGAATQAGLVRSAQDPCVFPAQRVSPERSLTDVERDVGDPDRQLGSFPIADGMDRS